jgi:hypothetical protein
MKSCDKCKHLEKRLVAQSRRIKKLSRKFFNYVDNSKYYIKRRLPAVLKREKLKYGYLKVAMKSMEDLRVMFKQIRFTPNVRRVNDGKRLYPVFMEHSDRTKLQKFLNYDLREYKIVKQKGRK